MQVKNSRSRIAVARRAQIVEATIQVLAEDGYERASFARITKEAGLSSTRSISYHFADRDELMGQVAAQVIGELGAAVEARVRAAGSPADAVRAYLEANLGFMDEHRLRMRALTSLLYGGALRIPPGQASAGVEALTAIIVEGQRCGQFSDVDAGVAATIVQRTVEGIALDLRDRPDVDLGAYASTLVRFFDAALTAPPLTPEST